MPVTVAIDAMGGDHGPSVTLAAALAFLEETPDARVIAVGLEEPLKAALSKLKSTASDRLSIVGLSALAPNEPLTVLVKKPDGTTVPFIANHTMSPEQIGWFRAGSALNIIRQQMNPS